MFTVSLAQSLLNSIPTTPKARCNILCTDSQEQECLFDVGILNKLSYQAIMDAFTQQIGGRSSLAQNSNDTLILDTNTGIETTGLSQTAKLAFSNDYDQFSSAHWTYLQGPQ
jgi:hypothetical protein